MRGLFTRRVAPPPGWPPPLPLYAWDERIDPDHDQAQRTQIAVRLMWSVEPTDRALAGWSGWSTDNCWRADR
jgi:hypothetical protein